MVGASARRGGSEPIRNPDAYPTGKNFYGIDPDKVPKPAAWRLGVFLADRMLRDHVAEHGRYPEKVSFVIWDVADFADRLRIGASSSQESSS